MSQTETPAEIIDALAGRDDLTPAETMRLRDARRAEASRDHVEIIDRAGWRVTLTRHVGTHGGWSAEAYLIGQPISDASLRCLSAGSGTSEADTRAAVERFFSPGGVAEAILARRST